MKSTVRALIPKSVEKQQSLPTKATHEFWKISIHCELPGRRPRSILDPSNKSEYAFITSWNAATLLHKLRRKNPSRSTKTPRSWHGKLLFQTALWFAEGSSQAVSHYPHFLYIKFRFRASKMALWVKVLSPNNASLTIRV